MPYTRFLLPLNETGSETWPHAHVQTSPTASTTPGIPHRTTSDAGFPGLPGSVSDDEDGEDNAGHSPSSRADGLPAHDSAFRRENTPAEPPRTDPIPIGRRESGAIPGSRPACAIAPRALARDRPADPANLQHSVSVPVLPATRASTPPPQRPSAAPAAPGARPRPAHTPNFSPSPPPSPHLSAASAAAQRTSYGTSLRRPAAALPNLGLERPRDASGAETGDLSLGTAWAIKSPSRSGPGGRSPVTDGVGDWMFSRSIPYGKRRDALGSSDSERNMQGSEGLASSALSSMEDEGSRSGRRGPSTPTSPVGQNRASPPPHPTRPPHLSPRQRRPVSARPASQTNIAALFDPLLRPSNANVPLATASSPARIKRLAGKFGQIRESSSPAEGHGDAALELQPSPSPLSAPLLYNSDVGQSGSMPDVSDHGNRSQSQAQTEGRIARFETVSRSMDEPVMFLSKMSDNAETGSKVPEN